ncbi:universal stress protein [Trichothermofontia sichuanensis B231]|uniref:universal stress protein n=1 Tax=Trichothermofontia sichuanensis TaxID=3045816 RepID=UPI002246C333|nr:universal stress protein [Trichothermofontia sichuanensis]UZQ55173.1 universal stress protein [Trichothermofontia sichuanensis B231]
MFKTVLFPIDQSRESREAAGTVADIVKTYGSKLLLLSVVEEPPAGAPPRAGDEVMSSPAAIAELLEEAQTFFSQLDIQTEAVERQGQPAFVICDVADEMNVDLIVMGCRGLGLTEEGAAESVTYRVINLSPCPVLIVP